MGIVKLFSVFVLAGLAATATAQVFVGDLNGTNEVPPGSPDGTGLAAIWIADGLVHFDLVVDENVAEPLTLAHIHEGEAGATGSVILDFTPFINGRQVRGSIEIETSLAGAIASNPAGYYFNIHNDSFPGGAVRDQLRLQPTTRLFSDLRAENEVPPVPPGPVGATGFADVRLGGFAAAFDFSADGIDLPPTLNHIHQGSAVTNGPVVVDFDPAEWIGDGMTGTARGIVVGSPTAIDAVIQNPEGHYVNIHTDNAPLGAIRGQLTLPPDLIFGSGFEVE